MGGVQTTIEDPDFILHSYQDKLGMFNRTSYRQLEKKIPHDLIYIVIDFAKNTYDDFVALTLLKPIAVFLKTEKIVIRGYLGGVNVGFEEYEMSTATQNFLRDFFNQSHEISRMIWRSNNRKFMYFAHDLSKSQCLKIEEKLRIKYKERINQTYVH